ncbi:Protoporphyrinogen oxidase [Serendipita vermifera]|nr:Protoporphyrinogen oxidase [Serendipita vermifera]
MPFNLPVLSSRAGFSNLSVRRLNNLQFATRLIEFNSPHYKHDLNVACKTRKYVSTANTPSNRHGHVVILGAGISGLTAAYYLQRRLPETRITIIEEKPRLGGWIESPKVDLGQQYGRVTLEAGPRTLRPVSKSLLELVNLLGLQKDIITVPKTAPAALNRYLCLSGPDGNGIKVLPSSPFNLFFSSFFFTLVSSVLLERYSPANRPQPIPVPESEKLILSQRMKVYDDESVDAFLTRRFGSKVARLFGSALVHGVYAADSRLLSVRASFPSLWEAEDRGKGSVISGILKTKPNVDGNQAYELGELASLTSNTSVYSFKDGISALPNAMQKVLDSNKAVDIRLSTAVEAIEPNSDGTQVHLKDGTSINASHVVSCVPLPRLSNIIKGVEPLPHLNFNPYSSVTVVNLVFATSFDKLHPAGFGYLVPRPVEGYTDPDNFILGTVFDSCALSQQDEASSSPITKLTVMCGGPFNTENVSIDRLLDQLFRHLQRPRIEPIHVSIHQQRDCIPLPKVGHLERMEEVKRKLIHSPWDDKLSILGAGVSGAGIADCVKAARSVALSL